MAEYEEVEAFLDKNLPEQPRLYGDLGEALYTLNELGLWEDGIELSGDQVLTAWALVEFLRENKWPKSMVM